MSRSDSICTGSHMNQWTFQEDDYWASFQSTIVSGQVMSVEKATTSYTEEDEENTSAEGTSYNDQTSIGELSTLIEHNIPVEELLNMNIDVIPNADPDDKFYDCPNFEENPANLSRIPEPQPRIDTTLVFSRPYVKQRNLGVQYSSPPDNNNNSSSNRIDCQASPRKQRPESARRISPLASRATSTASELSPSTGVRTGSMLVRAIDDYNDIKDHAQSTPKHLDSGNPSSGSFIEEASSFQSQAIIEARKTLDFDDSHFHNAETIVIQHRPDESKKVAEVSVSNKENFFNGKYSQFVTVRAAPDKRSPKKVVTRSGKVKLLAQFYQSRVIESIYGRSFQRSKIPLPVRKSSQMLSHVKVSPQAKARTSGSPSYQTRKSYKLISSRCSSSKAHPSMATTFSSSGGESFLSRNQRKLPRTTRVQSCSDATNVEVVSIDETSKSRSTGDLSRGPSLSIRALHSSKITKRKVVPTKKISPQSTFSVKKASAIMSRKSVGMQLNKNASPVKPVAELCKIFTPSTNAKPMKPPKPAKLTGNITQKSLLLPKIVITPQ